MMVSDGQGWLQIGELATAFALSAAIGLERQIRGKSAGLRTQTIVGTASALILLVSKYGFGDILTAGQVVLDPSRIAAQIVSGVGFLGAGLIITRQGAIRGLTTAAAVWETAAIGMAAGAGLPLLAIVVTAMHFVVVLGFTWLTEHLPGGTGTTRLRVSYVDGKGVLRDLLELCTKRRWSITSLRITDDRDGEVTVSLDLTGPGHADAATVLAVTDGVRSIETADDD
ncbi:MgtC/SapB family protein [Amycolatopsis oliviviridis]|uniref:Magnesium transport MgtC family protein n=2 Tax=Amycolatopsis oliviviridis TaxID=1471590 RepID=A0ABQ3LT27_9PSEU|nr:putative magnesium transport MgtC family protein [Amycolatopsis oliviviridis]